MQLNNHTEINNLGGIEAQFKSACSPRVGGGGCSRERALEMFHLGVVVVEEVVAGIGNTW